MQFSKNQSAYKGHLISWNETDGYFSATFHRFFYKKGVGFTHFKTAADVKRKIDEMMSEEKGEETIKMPEPEVVKKKKSNKK